MNERLRNLTCKKNITLLCAPTLLLAAGCMPSSGEGLARAPDAKTKVAMDFHHRPLPVIPLPNDVATRYDASSPTKRRINASMVAPTKLEAKVRQLFDQLDGWGVFQQITIPFTGPLDVKSITDAHHGDDYDLSNDVFYLINVDRKSDNFGKLYHLDLGNGNYPVVLERREFWPNDPREWTLSLTFEEEDEDKNGNGKLDPGEDTDADGVLDKPNYYPGMKPARDDLAGRADALMSFYEAETYTVIARPMIPLEERTTYAVVVTRRLLDADGQPVGSPFEYINATSQTRQLEALPEVLPEGLSLSDVAYAFPFTTQTIESNWVAVRDGLYGSGLQKHLGEEFPAELAGLEKLRHKDNFPNMSNPHIMYTENWLGQLKELYEDVFENDTDGYAFIALEKGHKYIDYHVIGTYNSPQLFTRNDPDGKPLPLHDQVWPEDLTTEKAKARSEKVFFWLTVPRKEVSARGQGQPAPVVILGHGYSSSRIEALPFSGHFAKHGFATLAIDCVSHGVGVSELLLEAAKSIFGEVGLEEFVQAALQDRATDLNGDLERDSGADFWTAYLFHTRDVVRQSAVDYMQLTRILRSFDGTRRWKFDVNGDGTPELAGDFDGDGNIDVGNDATIGITGGSLGGIMSLVVGGLDPNIDVSVPIAGGGGLSDIGVRSQQGGVREAVVLRMLAPLYVGTTDDNGVMKVETIIPDLNSWAAREITRVQDVAEGDTVVVENMVNGERGCAYVAKQPDGKLTFRAAVASDRLDRTNISFYKGAALKEGDTECGVKGDAEPYRIVDKFDRQIYFQAEYVVDENDPLVSLAEGFGLRRAHPETRRFMSLAQVVLDGTDPAVLGRHMLTDRIHYPASDQTTGAHLMVVTTVGDMNVPASSGLSIGRAVGLIDYTTPHARLGGKTVNQALLDTYTAEAVHSYKRYTWGNDPNGRGVHMDIENFSQGTDHWGTNIPRLQEPIRAGLRGPNGEAVKDALGGRSGAIFPYPKPEGEHGFAFPGELTDTAIKECKRACTTTSTTSSDPCMCEDQLVGKTFDIGFFMFNVLGKYFKAAGKEVDFSVCNSDESCAQVPAQPSTRDPATLQ